MVDPDVVAARLLSLNGSLAELARPAASDADALARDPVLRAAVERWLQIAIEACIDLAFHAVATRGLPAPESARAAFLTLAQHGLIEHELARRLGGATGLRNVLVHEYVTVDLDALARVVREDLGDLRAFGALAGCWLEEPPE